jgi:hypothetical protein
MPIIFSRYKPIYCLLKYVYVDLQPSPSYRLDRALLTFLLKYLYVWLLTNLLYWLDNVLLTWLSRCLYMGQRPSPFYCLSVCFAKPRWRNKYVIASRDLLLIESRFHQFFSLVSTCLFRDLLLSNTDPVEGNFVMVLYVNLCFIRNCTLAIIPTELSTAFSTWRPLFVDIVYE